MVSSCSAHGCTQRHKKGCGISFHRFPTDEELRKKWVIALQRKGFVPTQASKVCGKHFKKEDYVFHFGQLGLVKNAVPSVFDFSKSTRKKKSGQHEDVAEPNQAEEKPIILSNVCISKAVIVTNLTSEVGENSCNSPVTPIVNIENKVATRTTPNKELPVVKRPKVSTETQTEITHSLSETNPKISQSNVLFPKSITSLNLAQSGIEMGLCITPPIPINFENDVPIRPRRGRCVPVYLGDFKEEDLKSSYKVRRMWEIAKTTVQKQKSTIRCLRSKNKRLVKQIEALNETIAHLRRPKPSVRVFRIVRRPVKKLKISIKK